jgi:hypothetical protein
MSDERTNQREVAMKFGAPVRRRLVPLVLDVASIVLFVVAGRDSHDEEGGLGEVLTVAAPFLVGLGLAWLASPRLRRRPTSLRAGVDAWVSTVAIGMLLRRVVWDRGTALSFVVVTTVVLGFLLLGWRAVSSLTRRRGEITSARPPSKAGR